MKTRADPFLLSGIIWIGNLPRCGEPGVSLFQQLTSLRCVARLQGENGRVEEQIWL